MTPIPPDRSKKWLWEEGSTLVFPDSGEVKDPEVEKVSLGS